jgi:thymidylate synthase
MNKLDQDYQNLLGLILGTGEFKEDRTGTGTISIFGEQIRHDMSNGFPLLTTKKMAVKAMVTELKWFLKGDTNIKYLVDNNCNIWNGDAYKAYMAKYGYDNIDCPLSMGEFITKIKTDNEFAREHGYLGRIYGSQWREWIGFEQHANHAETIYVDQIANLIRNLKSNPNSRRLMVSAWNPSEIDKVVLPPCHYGFQCYVNSGKLSLMWNQRSVDTLLGLPFNIASYGLLLLLLCEETGYEPGELIGNLGDTHLYLNHMDQAKEQVKRESYDLPTIKLSNVDILNGEFDYEIIDYKFHPTIKAPLSN